MLSGLCMPIVNWNALLALQHVPGLQCLDFKHKACLAVLRCDGSLYAQQAFQSFRHTTVYNSQ